MNPEERLEQLERQLEQTQAAFEGAFALLFGLVTEDAWRKTITNSQQAADWLLLLAGTQEDKENHIAAQLLGRLAQRVRGE